MKEEHILRYTREEIDALPDETDWARVENMTDEEVYEAALSDPDAQPTDEAFWKDARLILSENYLCVEPDILEWFKAKGQENYQAHINAVLRNYVAAHRDTR